VKDCCIQAYHETWDDDGNDHNPCIVIDLILEFRHGYRLWLSVSSAPYIEEDPDIPENIMFSVFKCPKDKGRTQLLVRNEMPVDEFMDTWTDIIPKLNEIDNELDETLKK